MQVVFTLKQTLDNLGMTRHQLSNAAGVRDNTVIDMCANKVNRVHMDALSRIMAVLVAEGAKQNKTITLLDVMTYAASE